jgi:ribonuclease HII
MHIALRNLDMQPEFILVDGNRFYPFEMIPHTCIISGDAKYRSIAAASILAKTYRDDHMQSLHESYPDYGWNQNKGYPTEIHRSAILELGLTSEHRRSFKSGLSKDGQLDMFTV